VLRLPDGDDIVTDVTIDEWRRAFPRPGKDRTGLVRLGNVPALVLFSAAELDRLYPAISDTVLGTPYPPVWDAELHAAVDRIPRSGSVEQVDNEPRNGGAEQPRRVRGRPRATSIKAVEKEARRRLDASEAFQSVSEEARHLEKWARQRPDPEKAGRSASEETKDSEPPQVAHGSRLRLPALDAIRKLVGHIRKEAAQKSAGR
jgi:hypothetical protein